MKVSVIFPARNEEKLISAAVLDVFKYLKHKNISFEILVIENGSVDNTVNTVKELLKGRKEIKLLKADPGYGMALKKGFEKATGNYIAVFNVDFYDLHLIDLIDVELLGKDMIIGSKMTPWSEDKRPLQRKLISYVFNLYLRVFYKFKGSDTHGIKVIKKQVIDDIYKKCKTSSGIFDTEFVLRTQYAGYKIADYPVEVSEKRPPRFSNRLYNTPKDILNLYYAFKK